MKRSYSKREKLRSEERRALTQLVMMLRRMEAELSEWLPPGKGKSIEEIYEKMTNMKESCVTASASASETDAKTVWTSMEDLRKRLCLNESVYTLMKSTQMPGLHFVMQGSRVVGSWNESSPFSMAQEPELLPLFRNR